MKNRLTAAILTALMVTGMTACGTDGEKEPTKTVTVTATETETETVEPTPEPEEPVEDATPATDGLHKLGQKVTLKSMDGKADVTVKEFMDPAPEEEFALLEEGDRLVAVKLEVKNTGSSKYDDSPSNGMKVADTQGQWYDASLDSTEAGPDIGSPRLVSGDRAVGWVTFAVPKSAKLTKLQITLDSGFGPESAEWSLKK